MLAAASAEIRPLGQAGPMFLAPKPEIVPASKRRGAAGISADIEIKQEKNSTIKIAYFMSLPLFIPGREVEQIFIKVHIDFRLLNGDFLIFWLALSPGFNGEW